MHRALVRDGSTMTKSGDYDDGGAMFDTNSQTSSDYFLSESLSVFSFSISPVLRYTLDP